MRKATVLVAAAAAGVAVTTGFFVGWLFSSKEPAAAALETRIPDRDLVTGSIPSRAIGAPVAPQPQALPAPQARMAAATAPAALPTRNQAAAEAVAPKASCKNPGALGVS